MGAATGRDEAAGAALVDAGTAEAGVELGGG